MSKSTAVSSVTHFLSAAADDANTSCFYVTGFFIFLFTAPGYLAFLRWQDDNALIYTAVAVA